MYTNEPQIGFRPRNGWHGDCSGSRLGDLIGPSSTIRAMDDVSNILPIVTNQMTVTLGPTSILAGATAPAYGVVNGRPCLSVGMGTTDENIWQAQSNSGLIIGDNTVIARVRGAINVSATTDLNVFVGLSALDTSVASTTSLSMTDYLGLHKLEDGTTWVLSARKASGTPETYTIANLTIAADVWLDFDIVAVRDEFTSGMGIAYVSTGVSTAPGAKMTNHDVAVPILTQFPDTVAQHATLAARQQSTTERFVRVNSFAWKASGY